MLTLHQNTKAKCRHAQPLSTKLGQKGIRRASSLAFELNVLNEKLDEVSPGLRQMCFKKGDPQQKGKQAPIPGAEIPDSALTDFALNTGEIDWLKEQTGCKLTIDMGLGDRKSNIVLTGTVKKQKYKPLDGGGVKVRFTFNSDPADEVDQHLLGRLMDLKDRECYLQLTPPEVQQDDLPGATVTPIQALAGTEKKKGAKNDAEPATTH
jgi:hypothetical protein